MDISAIALQGMDQRSKPQISSTGTQPGSLAREQRLLTPTSASWVSAKRWQRSGTRRPCIRPVLHSADLRTPKTADQIRKSTI